MADKKESMAKHLHLIVSVIILLPTGIIYGSPKVLPQLLDIPVSTIDLSNLLKAMMFLCFGVSAVWILGVWKAAYWTRATELNALFMLSLGMGRSYSMLLDGMPSSGYVFGVIAEFAIGLFALYQLKKYKPTTG